MWKFTVILGLLALGTSIYLSYSPELSVPTLEETQWGPKDKKPSTEIRPFKIDVPASVIQDLKERLERRRPLPAPLENVKWTYGISSKYLDAIVDYWKNKYNWTERQELLNKYPQFMTNIQGLNIHYYHVKPTATRVNGRDLKVVPLLIVHGWPGSVVEFQKLIPMLTTPTPNADFVFEVIAPSIPGYGFSDAAVRPGMNPAQIALVFKNLMKRIGFEKFYVQGGDWGAAIVTNMAILYPENVIGLHSNMCSVLTMSTHFWKLIGSYFPSLVVENEHYSKVYPLKEHYSHVLEESGYFHLQATKPDTVGVALSSSPEGLAAYILEKFSTWTNKAYKQREDGGLLEKFTMDELLDNVMIYWVTNSITTSTRLYSEFVHHLYRSLNLDYMTVKRPTACALFPNELIYTPKSLLPPKYINLIQSNDIERGGHFAAFEEPGLMAKDIISFVEKVEKMAVEGAKNKK